MESRCRTRARLGLDTTLFALEAESTKPDSRSGYRANALSASLSSGQGRVTALRKVASGRPRPVGSMVTEGAGDSKRQAVHDPYQSFERSWHLASSAPMHKT